MSTQYVLLVIAIMAVCTYLPRVLPLVLFRKKITNPYISSLLTYLPYGILAAMIFPDVFTSGGALISSIAGTAVALVVAWHKKGLLLVAVSAVATVFICERILAFI